MLKVRSFMLLATVLFVRTAIANVESGPGDRTEPQFGVLQTSPMDTTESRPGSAEQNKATLDDAAQKVLSMILAATAAESSELLVQHGIMIEEFLNGYPELREVEEISKALNELRDEHIRRNQEPAKQKVLEMLHVTIKSEDTEAIKKQTEEIKKLLNQYPKLRTDQAVSSAMEEVKNLYRKIELQENKQAIMEMFKAAMRIKSLEEFEERYRPIKKLLDDHPDLLNDGTIEHKLYYLNKRYEQLSLLRAHTMLNAAKRATGLESVEECYEEFKNFIENNPTLKDSETFKNELDTLKKKLTYLQIRARVHTEKMIATAMKEEDLESMLEQGQKIAKLINQHRYLRKHKRVLAAIENLHKEYTSKRQKISQTNYIPK